jgi:topoisomerase-4 subunit A
MIELTYKGAHEHRPADQLDVDTFVGVKSPQAKGKRLSTFDVATVRFIEPEQPIAPEPDGGEEADVEEPMTSIELTEEIDLTPVAPIPPTGSVPFEVERPRGDADELIDPAQLNLF